MRVVVVGNGMVGSRFVEELVRAAPGTDVVVLGAEEYEPYNRVLLSEVVAGSVELAATTLPRQDLPGVEVRRGRTAVALDRHRRVVVTDADEVRYDVLVLATGARARVPDVPGLGALPAGVHALRTLDDAREVVAATANARRGVVLGGGVLGLEVACGLARRGLAVTLVHGGEHVMDRQLDGAAGSAVAAGLDRLGVERRTGVVAAEVVVEHGRLRSVVLTDGEALATDLLVLTAGTVAEAGLARDAGLPVRRGVVVDSDGRTADPRVYAIGDCAEPPEGGTGLVAQGWDQARRLARLLGGDGGTASRGAGPRPVAGDPTDVVRVKAHGLQVVAMGRPTPGARRVTLSDPAAGRHVDVTVHDGVVVGATCVGSPEVAADLVAAYTRRTPVPADPAQLVLRPVRGAAAPGTEPSPTLMPDRTTVCRCNGVTKGDLVAAWRTGATDVPAVARATRATTGCGGCTEAVCGLLDWLRRSDPQAGPAQESEDSTAAGVGTSAAPDDPVLARRW